MLYTFPQSVGIAGGRPSSSYYFVGSGLFYLDPHHSLPAVPLRPYMGEAAPLHPHDGHHAPDDRRSLNPEAYARDGSMSPEFARGGSMSPELVYPHGGSMSPEYSHGQGNTTMTKDELVFILSAPTPPGRACKMALSGLDPSMLIGFVVRDEAGFRASPYHPSTIDNGHIADGISSVVSSFWIIHVIYHEFHPDWTPCQPDRWQGRHHGDRRYEAAVAWVCQRPYTNKRMTQSGVVPHLGCLLVCPHYLPCGGLGELLLLLLLLVVLFFYCPLIAPPYNLLFFTLRTLGLVHFFKNPHIIFNFSRIFLLSSLRRCSSPAISPRSPPLPHVLFTGHPSRMYATTCIYSHKRTELINSSCIRLAT